MAALIILAPPGGEYATDDDWDYAITVKRLVETGTLQISAWAQTTLLLQIGWGSLFARAFGFSHTILRVSTLVLAAIGVLSFYALVRQCLDDRWASALALLLLFNPLYVALSYSFMTDVPFLSLAIASLACCVRALRPGRPGLGWLSAGSALAAAASLIRPLGACLLPAAAGGLALNAGWRYLLRPASVAAILGPFVPAVIFWALLDSQRGPSRLEPIPITLDFWRSRGVDMIDVELWRLAGSACTLGLFVLPLTANMLLGRSRPRMARWQRWLIVCLLVAVALGFLLHIRSGSWRFPQLSGTVTARGFQPFYEERAPISISLQRWVVLPATGASLLGAGLLVVVVVLASARGIRSGQLAVPLVFGLLVLIQSLVYERFYDRFLIAVLPSALLAAALCVHRNQLAYRSALLGALVLAGWSIWWERDYMGRQGAIWQVCRTVVELGIPADQLDCGFEWNGWYRGEQTMAEAVALAPTRSGADRLSDAILARLSPPSSLAHWRMDFVLRETPCPDRVLAVATYGNGNRVYGLERC